MKYSLKELKRVDNKFKDYLLEKDNKTFAGKDFSILFPVFYTDKDLARIETLVEALCVFMIVDEMTKEYSVVSIPVKQKFSPKSIIKVTLDDIGYYKMTFSKGSVVCPSNDCVKSSDFLFYLFESFYLRGKVPSFLRYDEIGDILKEASKYCGSRIGDNIYAFYIISAIMTRVENDETKLFKEVLETYSDLLKYKCSYKGISNMFFGIDDTASAIIGGYLSEGILGSIIKPETESTKIANILRS